MTKKLSAHYKNPETQAHKVLADRIAERDPGNAPMSNDRLPFVFVGVDPQKCTKNMMTKAGRDRMEKGSKLIYKEHVASGYKIETVEYINASGLSIDYEEYILKQIANPIINIMRLEIPLPVLEYLFEKIIGKCVGIHIKQNKKKNAKGEVVEITETAEIKVKKAIPKNRKVEIPRNYVSYVDFIPEYRADLDNSYVVEIANVVMDSVSKNKQVVVLDSNADDDDDFIVD